ncbi:MAG: ATP synthase F1 subunit gamma [Eubacteriaceae bacterium]|jgi:F-type H+-transporting ATPase subunit gamma|nr:ATP synthase F1 subunit gamma [Eubacteriaceae bacterium]
MQSLTEIKNRLKAVEETRKITNTMKLVSTSRIKKVVKSLEYNKNYFDYMSGVMSDIVSSIGAASIDHPYLVGHKAEEPKKLFIVVAGDRGLCGAYNRNVLELAYRIISKERNPSYLTVGKVARSYFRKMVLHTNGIFLKFDSDHSLRMIRRMINALTDLYEKQYIDEVYIIFTPYDGGASAAPECRKILPIEAEEFMGAQSEAAHNEEILYVIDKKETFDLLVPQYLIGMIYDLLFQAYAGEQLARMSAMDASTQNADELLASLSLTYNLTRQASITNEIAEVASASAADARGGRKRK